MNILHLRASNFYGGPERQLHIHARLADSTRYAVTIGSFSEAGNTPEFLKIIAEDGVPTHTFPVTGAYDRHAISLVRQWLRANHTDIICTHDYRSHLIGWLAKRGLAVKWIAFSRGFTWDNWKIRVYHWVEKILVRFAQHIIAVSEAQKAKLVRLRIPSSKITVVHNAIDLQAIASVTTVDLRARFGLPPDSILVVSAGRFSREKGQSVLIHAAAVAVKKRPQLRIILFGNGPDLEQIKQLVRDLKVEQQVICPGFERNALGCIKGADMLVNPSLTEGLPNIVLEGMALGVPVIATAVGGVPELIHDQRNGLLIPSQDQYAMADAMMRLAESKELRTHLAAEALSTLQESFSFEGQMAKLATIYDLVGRQ